MTHVCVFCGSSAGAGHAYLDAAGELGRELTRRGATLVYGGASVGLMGALADAVLADDGRVIGVVPRRLVERERAHTGLSELRVVGSLHERKAVMAELADGFMALPGGLGTLEELIEVLSWGQLGLHEKPCGLLNVAGYYDSLLSFLDHSVAEGFFGVEHRAELIVERSPAAILDRIERHEPRVAGKWSEGRR